MFSRADVATATPERYAKQLVAHLGRKVSFSTDGGISTAMMGDATGRIIVGDGVLTLTATGSDPAAVAVVEDVLGRHLERFGARNELAVHWARGVTTRSDSSDQPSAVSPPLTLRHPPART